MKLFHGDPFTFPLAEGYTFPIEKHSLLRERITEGSSVGPEEILMAAAANQEDILRVQFPDYAHRFVQGRLSPAEMRRIGFPWSPELVERTVPPSKGAGVNPDLNFPKVSAA